MSAEPFLHRPSCGCDRCAPRPILPWRSIVRSALLAAVPFYAALWAIWTALP